MAGMNKPWTGWEEKDLNKDFVEDLVKKSDAVEITGTYSITEAGVQNAIQALLDKLEEAGIIINNATLT